MIKWFLIISMFMITANQQAACQGFYNMSEEVTGLHFPVSFDIDDSGNYYVALKGGSSNVLDAMVNIYDPAGALLGTVWDFSDSVQVIYERGVLGIALDPNYNVNNFLYVFYNHKTPSKIRVVRFEIVGFTGVNPTLVLDIDDPNTAGNHTGGNIHFRPSEPDNLYITIGERGTPAHAQDLTNPFGKILRIKSDGTIPNTNPFYDDGDVLVGNDDRIWAYGLRNSFDFTFSPVNDSLYATENGQNAQDEVNQIVPGGNYGWPLCEGILDYNDSCTAPGLSPPLDVFGQVGSNLPSVTGAIVYQGSLMPEFNNHLLVVTYTDATMRDIALTNAPAYDQKDTVKSFFLGEFFGLTDIKQGADECIYIIDGGYTTNGRIIKICPSPDGITSYDRFKAVLFPNPAAEIVNIQTDQNIVKVDILAHSGQWIEEIQNSMQISVAHLSSGIYFLRIVNQLGEVVNKQFVKQ